MHDRFGVEDAKRLSKILHEDPLNHLDELKLLIGTLHSSSAEEPKIAAIQACHPFFVDVLHKELLSPQASGPDAARAAVLLITECYHSFWDLLLECLTRPATERLQVVVSNTVMDLVRAEHVGQFDNERFVPFIKVLLASKHVQPETVIHFMSQFGKYQDVQYYLAKGVQKIAEECSASGRKDWQADAREVSDTLLCVLESWPEPADAGCSWCGAAESGLVTAAPAPREGAKARKRRKAAEGSALGGDTGSRSRRAGGTARWACDAVRRQEFSNAWLAFLATPLPKEMYRRVLLAVTGPVMKRLTRPIVLCDFLTKAIDQGGYLGMLALNGLFILVTQHGLEYPDFYKRLYTLLTPQVMTARHRKTFLQLLDIFLASSLVPAYSVAAFIKRFAQMALTAPPHGAVTCLTFIHNLIRRHPSCMCLLHRPTPSERAPSSEGVDVYDARQEDPGASRAIESSLWELDLLRSHYNCQVAAAVTMLDRDLTNRKQTSEADVAATLENSYSSAIRRELARKLRSGPAVSEAVLVGDKAVSLFDSAAMPLGWALEAHDSCNVRSLKRALS